MKILSKYFLKELIFPFFVSLGIITFLFITRELIILVDLVLKYGVGPWTVLKLVSYIIPVTFAITVPMSLLVAVLLSFGRLAADMEFTALKAGGIGLPRLFLPILLLSLLMSGAMLVFNEYVLPRANLGYKILFYEIIRNRSNVLIQESTYIKDFEGFVIHVGKKDKRTGELKDVDLFLLPKGNQPLQVVTAKWGRLVSDPQSYRVYLELHDGVLQAPGGQDKLQLTQLFFEKDVIDIDINGQLGKVQGVERKPGEMSITEISDRISHMEAGNPDHDPWAVEMHNKIAIPFACLVFALIACPLGTLVRRGGRLLGFVFALGLIFDYYLCLSFGNTYGGSGRMPAWLGAWLPNFQLGAIGLWLTWVVLKERPLKLRLPFRLTKS